MGKRGLRELLDERVVIGDGAMGTMLYQKGVFLNTCYDELNLTRPEMIREIHCEYVAAGCDFIESNSFGANEFKLSRFGLADKVEQLNLRAVELAREAAGDSVLVAGAMGPCGSELAEYGRTSEDQAWDAFAKQGSVLAKGGVDFLILETFSNPDELLIAIDAVSGVCDLPIIAQLTSSGENQTIYGNKIEDAVARIAEHERVTVVGLNCGVGPVGTLNSLVLARQVTDKPISVQPNAGMPRDVDGRTMYMCTPEYMAEYSKRFFENGARVIGGCCGTTPGHIKEIVRSVRSLDKSLVQTTVVPRIRVSSAAEEKKGVEPVALADRSLIGKKLAGSEAITCIELTPPRGADLSAIIDKAKMCADYGVDAVNIPDGPRASSRISPMVTAAKIQEFAKIETILHVCCRDRNILGMQSDMLGAHALGLRNVLLITGDPPKLGEYPDATAVFDLDSIALTAVTSNLNRGLDIAGNEFHPPISLTIGVGANPVASELHREIDRFKQKTAAGAEYAITQPVFDTEMLFGFEAAVEKYNTPIIAGIWPFTSYKNAEFMANEVPGVVVPDKLLKRMAAAKTRDQGRRIGVEIAREMIAEVSGHIAGFAISAPFGNVRIALAAMGKIGIDEI